MNLQSLKMLQHLPLEIKVAKTKLRIKDAISYFGETGLYLSFSGGKDSTVLHTILKEVEMELWGEIRIPRVFCDTGLEYPELKNHVIEIFETLPEGLGVKLRPDKTFKQVLTNYGYPVISKEQSQYIEQYRKAKSEKTKITRWEGNRWGRGKISEKHKYLVKSDFPISDKCCNVMKKAPFKKYEKHTGRIPILGVMAEESALRQTHYIKNGGCNAFNNKRPQSKPIGFWREQDILHYIYDNNINIPSVYGEIVAETYMKDLFTIETEYSLTGLNRTGCMFCLYGIGRECGKNRIQKMELTHPKLYNYCVNGGKYNEKGEWIPSAEGLGLGHVLDVLNVEYKNAVEEELA